MSDEVRKMLDSTNFEFKDVDENGKEVIMTLSEAMESLNNENWKLARENIRLLTRIDKAIEYIINHTQSTAHLEMDTKSTKELLDILRGEE